MLIREREKRPAEKKKRLDGDGMVVYTWKGEEFYVYRGLKVAGE